MRPNIDHVEILFSGTADLYEMKRLPAMQTFQSEVCFFLNELSKAIRKDTEARKFSDIVTFSFFCRKANIELLRQQYFEPCQIGRGVSFHIAPSNVPINFAYTLAAGLLAGNACIVRVSSKDFPQTAILCRLIEQVILGHNLVIGKYIAIIKYKRNREINDYLSAFTDVRVIWGGDHTIEEIKKSPLPARSTEITFADRYSVCVLTASDVLKITDWKSVARNFYNDTYLYDQNACSSPRLMYWIGKEKDITAAKALFWSTIHKYVAPQYQIKPIIAVDKLTTDYRIAIEKDGVTLEPDADNLFHRIKLNKLDVDVTDYMCAGGSYLEYNSNDLQELGTIITKKYQTLSYLGGNGYEIAKWVVENGFSGVDRVVPMGKTADFNLTWDGYNLIQAMSRKVFYT